MQGKHFVDDPKDLVLHALQGLVALTPGLLLNTGAKIVYREHAKPQVALISGGGSGHEPAHAGFVADGMLSGAVCGSIFASPSASQIRRALDLLSSSSGSLLIVKNYTGDVLNFGLAKERFTPQAREGHGPVRMIIVADDVAVTRSQSAITGRRGLAGTILVHKIAGALAKSGASLDQVADAAECVASRLATIGVGSEHVHVPGTAVGTSSLVTTDIEIGMGVHNEPGARTLPLPPLSELIKTLVDMILSTPTTDPERGYLPVRVDGKDEVVLMVNNLGGVGGLEMHSIARAALEEMRTRNVHVKRVCVGTYMTSLNMPGFSLTLLLLPRGDESTALSASEILELLDAPTSCASWTPAVTPTTPSFNESEVKTRDTALSGPTAQDRDAYIAAIRRACKALVEAEPELTRFDTIAGDGDCGLTFRSGAQGILAKLDDGTIPSVSIAQDMRLIAEVAENTMGGTAGALCSIFFSALSSHLSSSPVNWPQSLQFALETLYKYTRARPPHSRTLIDPLAAFVNAPPGKGVEEAARAAEATRGLEAKAGRAAYVDREKLKDEGSVPDPGAWAVKIALEALLQT